MRKFLMLAVAVLGGAVAVQAQQIIPAYNEVKVKKHGTISGEFTVINSAVTPMSVYVEAKEVGEGIEGKPTFKPLSDDIVFELKDTSGLIPPKSSRTFEYKISCPRTCAVAMFSGMQTQKPADGSIAVRLWLPSVVWVCEDSAKDCRVRTKKAWHID